MESQANTQCLSNEAGFGAIVGDAIVVLMFSVCMVSVEIFKLKDTMPSKDFVVGDH